MKRRLFLLAVFLLVAGLIVSWLVGGALISPYRSEVGEAPSDLPIEAVRLPSESGATLAVWHLRAPESKGVVCLFHGIRSDRRALLERAEWLLSLGYSSVMVDLCAHGESTGEQVTLGYRESHDVLAALQYAREKHPEEAVGVIAISLGGAAALFAAPLGVDALVVESVFSDLRPAIENRVRSFLGPLYWIPTQLLLVQVEPRLSVALEELRPMDRVARVRSPILFLGGEADPFTPPAEIQAMFDAAPEPKEITFFAGVPHHDLESSARPEYRQSVGAFLSKFMR